ncbi:hypothetical protein ACX3T3_04965 [Actinotignum schaalii]
MPSYSYPGDGLLACVPGLAVFTPALPADPAAVWETVRAGHDFPTLLTHLWSALGADFALFYAGLGRAPGPRGIPRICYPRACDGWGG